MASEALSAFPLLSSASTSCRRKQFYGTFPRFHYASQSTNLESSILGFRLTIQPSSSRLFALKSRHLSGCIVLLSLPTAKPDSAVSRGTSKWSSRAIKSFTMAELEARKFKYPNTGTEALLMGILVEGTSQAAQFLRRNGITLLKVREEILKLLGKSDVYFFSPEHPPLTEPAQRALDWAVDEKHKSDESREISATDMLLGIWAEKEGAGHRIMATFGFDDEKANELAKLCANKKSMM